jgi:formylglycine-generating enzyme required for sulfatase activity
LRKKVNAALQSPPKPDPQPAPIAQDKPDRKTDKNTPKIDKKTDKTDKKNVKTPNKPNETPIAEPALSHSVQAATIADIENNMVQLQGGTFKMGSNEDNDEKPIHSVTIPPFSISKYEVTQAQWEAVMGASENRSYHKNCALCPVENVSFDDIQTFLQKLNTKTGKAYRLATEAEWEFAARGGTSWTDNNLYSGGNTLKSVGWYTENSGDKTHPVGQRTPNQRGLYDMSGNVWEWCSDWYKGYPGSTGVTDYTGSDRVGRGGSWRNDATYCRTAIRRYTPTDRNGYLGFRLCRSL